MYYVHKQILMCCVVTCNMSDAGKEKTDLDIVWELQQHMSVFFVLQNGCYPNIYIYTKCIWHNLNPPTLTNMKFKSLTL
jgi:hypothetical protein